jgi:hypothetical protein
MRALMIVLGVVLGGATMYCIQQERRGATDVCTTIELIDDTLTVSGPYLPYPDSLAEYISVGQHSDKFVAYYRIGELGIFSETIKSYIGWSHFNIDEPMRRVYHYNSWMYADTIESYAFMVHTNDTIRYFHTIGVDSISKDDDEIGEVYNLEVPDSIQFTVQLVKGIDRTVIDTLHTTMLPSATSQGELLSRVRESYKSAGGIDSIVQSYCYTYPDSELVRIRLIPNYLGDTTSRNIYRTDKIMGLQSDYHRNVLFPFILDFESSCLCLEKPSDSVGHRDPSAESAHLLCFLSTSTRDILHYRVIVKENGYYEIRVIESAGRVIVRKSVSLSANVPYVGMINRKSMARAAYIIAIARNDRVLDVVRMPN